MIIQNKTTTTDKGGKIMSTEDFGETFYDEDDGEVNLHYWITKKGYCYKEIYVSKLQKHYKKRISGNEYQCAVDRVFNY